MKQLEALLSTLTRLRKRQEKIARARGSRRCIERLTEAKTMLGAKRVSVHRGQTDENGHFFSNLLVHHAAPTEQLSPEESRPWHQHRRQQVEIAVHVGSG